MSTQIERLETMIAGLTELKTFLIQRPDLQERLYVHKLIFGLYAYNDKKEFSRLARLLARGMKLIKEYTEYSCSVARSFGDMVSLEVRTSREAVCERIIIGKKVIPEQIIPAREEDIIEWKCK